MVKVPSTTPSHNTPEKGSSCPAGWYKKGHGQETLSQHLCHLLFSLPLLRTGWAARSMGEEVPAILSLTSKDFKLSLRNSLKGDEGGKCPKLDFELFNDSSQFVHPTHFIFLQPQLRLDFSVPFWSMETC